MRVFWLDAFAEMATRAMLRMTGPKDETSLSNPKVPQPERPIEITKPNLSLRHVRQTGRSAHTCTTKPVKKPTAAKASEAKDETKRRR